MMGDVVRDEAYWAEVEEAVGTGTRSLLWGTSTRSLKRGLAELRAVVEETYRTKTGKELTEADIEALADEAERGYDVSQLHPRLDLLQRQRMVGDAIILERAVNVLLRRGFLHLPLLQQLGQFAADLRKQAEGE